MGIHKTAAVFLISSVLFLGGCSSKTTLEIEDMRTFSQDISDYDFTITPAFLPPRDKAFDKAFFAPWHDRQMRYSKKEASWGFMYAKKTMHGSNLKPLLPQWFDNQKQKANMQAYGSLAQKAVTVKNADMRVLPTNKPLFANPDKPGEGYPFDYNQNAGIKINTPLLVSHFSADGAWVLVQTGFALGWTEVENIAFVSDRQAKDFENGPRFVSVQDKVNLYSDGFFQAGAKLGTLFSMDADNSLYIFVQSNNLMAKKRTVQAKPFALVKHPLLFHEPNIKSIIAQLQGEKYGWGEAGFLRDCSAMTRDFFTVFGLYLPRNSAAQARAGRYVSLEDMNAGQKRKLITQKARPLRTLLYMPGHIMLYLKTHEDKIVIFHNFWGIPTRDWRGNEGRFIVGKAAITGLTPGSKLPGF
ncbi:MAG: SH3 domain-containing protein, partial [Campylobacterota bacterium]